MSAPARPSALTVHLRPHGEIWLADEEQVIRAKVLYIAGQETEALATARRMANAEQMETELRWAVEWMERYEGQTMPEWREWAARGRTALNLTAVSRPDGEADGDG